MERNKQKNGNKQISRAFCTLNNKFKIKTIFVYYYSPTLQFNEFLLRIS